MKKIVWGMVVVAIIMFITLSKSPLDAVMNFVVGGVVPGTKASLGFWPMMVLSGLFVLALFRTLKNMRFSMLENTANQIRSEQSAKEFKEKNSSEVYYDKKQRSVIAASSAEINV